MDITFNVTRYNGKNEDKLNYIGKYYIEDTKNKKVVCSFNITDINWICRIGIISLELSSINNENKLSYVHNLIKSMVDYIYNELNLIKIKTQLYSNNEELISYLQKFGFEVEGFLKNELFSHGKFYDYIYLSLFKDSYNQNTIILDNSDITNIDEGDSETTTTKSIDSGIFPIKKLGSLFSLDISSKVRGII